MLHFPRNLWMAKYFQKIRASRNLKPRARNAQRNLCLQELTTLRFLREFVPSSTCRAHPSSSNSAWPLAPLVPQSRWPKFWDPPLPESWRERKLLCFSWNVGRIFMKFLVVTFMEIKGWKWVNIMTKISTRFSTMSANCFAWISLSGIMLIKDCGTIQLCLVTYTHSHTHRESAKRGKSGNGN